MRTVQSACRFPQPLDKPFGHLAANIDFEILGQVQFSGARIADDLSHGAGGQIVIVLVDRTIGRRLLDQPTEVIILPLGLIRVWIADPVVGSRHVGMRNRDGVRLQRSRMPGIVGVLGDGHRVARSRIALILNLFADEVGRSRFVTGSNRSRRVFGFGNIDRSTGGTVLGLAVFNHSRRRIVGEAVDPARGSMILDVQVVFGVIVGGGRSIKRRRKRSFDRAEVRIELIGHQPFVRTVAIDDQQVGIEVGAVHRPAGPVVVGHDGFVIPIVDARRCI